jgi:hypothetical protein
MLDVRKWRHKVIEYVYKTPDSRIIDVTRYLKQKELELIVAIAGKIKIYIDLNFLVDIANWSLGRIENDRIGVLYRRLMTSVKNGKIICPLSFDTVLEIAKQKDIVSRYATTLVAWQLSDCIVLKDFYARTEIEAFNFFIGSAKAERKTVGAAAELDAVWTKASVGNPIGFFPTAKEFLDASVPSQMRYVDLAWQWSLFQYIDTLQGRSDVFHQPMKEIADYLDANKGQHENDFKSFSDLFDTELINTQYTIIKFLYAGCQRAASYLVKDIKLTGYTEDVLSKMIAEPIAGKGFLQALKSAKATAMIHSIYRFEKSKRYKQNDAYDIHHAANALAYYDLFFTDGPLCKMLQNRKEVASEYPCRFAGSLDEAFDRLLEADI